MVVRPMGVKLDLIGTFLNCSNNVVYKLRNTNNYINIKLKRPLHYILLLQYLGILLGILMQSALWCSRTK